MKALLITENSQDVVLATSRNEILKSYAELVHGGKKVLCIKMQGEDSRTYDTLCEFILATHRTHGRLGKSKYDQ